MRVLSFSWSWVQFPPGARQSGSDLRLCSAGQRRLGPKSAQLPLYSPNSAKFSSRIAPPFQRNQVRIARKSGSSIGPFPLVVPDPPAFRRRESSLASQSTGQSSPLSVRANLQNFPRLLTDTRTGSWTSTFLRQRHREPASYYENVRYGQ